MNESRPKLVMELVWEDELPESANPTVLYSNFPCPFPHCDSRILHLPEECRYCAMFTALQEERAAKDISNTGHQNRRWTCPADEARTPEQYNAWSGNRAKLDEEA